MSFFERNIDLIKVTAKIMLRGSFTALFVVLVIGPMSMFVLAATAVFCVAKLVLSHAAETQRRMDRQAADAAAVRQAQRRAAREYELLCQIEQLQRADRRLQPAEC